jgi:hypothetical protein
MKIRPPDIRNSRQMGIEHRAKPIRTMTKTKIELKNEPDAADLKFPPDGLFTAVAIAQELGIHPDSIRKRYYSTRRSPTKNSSGCASCEMPIA